MLQLTHADVEDTAIDLTEMRVFVISRILAKASFFRDLTR